jgi:hypothetical protein
MSKIEQGEQNSVSSSIAQRDVGLHRSGETGEKEESRT